MTPMPRQPPSLQCLLDEPFSSPFLARHLGDRQLHDTCTRLCEFKCQRTDPSIAVAGRRNTTYPAAARKTTTLTQSLSRSPKKWLA